MPTIERILRFGSYYHVRLSCGHSFEVNLDTLNAWQLYIGKRYDCGQCPKDPLESCPKCGAIVHRSKAFVDHGAGPESGRTFYYCSDHCRATH